MVRIIDLSIDHDENISDSRSPLIVHWSHEHIAAEMARAVGIQAHDFPGGVGLSSDTVWGDSHSGTHICAPYSNGPKCENRPAKTVDQVPLDWCCGPGVILDMRHKLPGSEITVEDLQFALDRIGYSLNPGDIVILQTGCDKYWGTEDYKSSHSGLGRLATLWLLDQGIRCIGIDAWTIDRPQKAMVEDFMKTMDPGVLWPSHLLTREREFIQLEMLANLDQLPKTSGFKVIAFPVKFENGSSGWTRTVAIFE